MRRPPKTSSSTISQSSVTCRPPREGKEELEGGGGRETERELGLEMRIISHIALKYLNPNSLPNAIFYIITNPPAHAYYPCRVHLTIPLIVFIQLYTHVLKHVHRGIYLYIPTFYIHTIDINYL